MSTRSGLRREAPGAPGAPASPEVAEITEWAAFLERHGGPPEMLAAARSWLAMLGHPPDPQVADLFAVMVRVDRAIWLEWLNEHPAAADAALEQLRDIVRGTP